MKKKLPLKDIVIYSLLVVGVGGWATWTYYLSPTLEEYRTLSASVESLEIATAPLEQQGAYLDELRLKSEDQRVEISTFNKSDTKFVLNSQNLLAHLGAVAEKNDVSVTLFRELEHEENEDYTKTPFHLVLQGDYIQLLNVIDSIQEVDYNYTISEYSMKVIDVNPETNKPVENTRKNSLYKWTSGSNTYVTGEFPLFRVDDIDEEIVESKETEEEEELDFVPIKKVQIEFKLNFITLDGETEEKTTEFIVGETGKDNPFYHQIMELAKRKTDEIGDDYYGEDLQNLSDAKKAVFMTDKDKLQKEIDKTLVAIYNREQKKMATDTQMKYLQELLVISEGKTEVTSDSADTEETTSSTPSKNATSDSDSSTDQEEK